jgi:hypothetical protein
MLFGFSNPVRFSGSVTVTVDLDQEFEQDEDDEHKKHQRCANNPASINNNSLQLQIPIAISVEDASSAKSIIALQVRKAFIEKPLPLSLFPNVLKTVEISIQESLSQIHEEEIAKSIN